MRHLAALLLMLTGLATTALWFNYHRAEGIGGPSDFAGSYTVEMNVFSGEGHQPYIEMPDTIKLEFYSDLIDHAEGEMGVLGPPPFVTVYTDFLQEDYITKNDEGIVEFSMTGEGTVAGYHDVRVAFDGHIDRSLGSEAILTGKYTMGIRGELPGGYAISYVVKNATFSTFTPTPTDTPLPTLDVCMVAGDSCAATGTPTPPGPQETVAEFLELFNTAIQTGDESFLLDRLDPHVIETYGEANCAATVAAMVDPTSSFTIKSISGPAPWKWSPPGVSVLVDDVYTVSVERVMEGESSMQEIHLAIVQGHLTWFRTCADAPLATPTPEVCAIAGGSNCTPTATPTPQAVPPTPTRTPTPTPAAAPPTWTPTPRPGDGDCNHDGTTNALDALHVLQYTAGLIPNPGACGDTNQDGTTNTIDVSLILQYVADFISSLPWH